MADYTLGSERQPLLWRGGQRAMLLLTSLSLGLWLLHGQPLAAAGVGLMAWLAFENGANDTAKGVATVVAAGLLHYRQALLVGAGATLVGSVTALWTTQGLVKLFSSGLLAAGTQMTATLALSVLMAAGAWVCLSTRLALPVSTTHAITGAAMLGGAVALGANQVNWPVLASKVVMPLLLSPVLALAAGWAFWTLISRMQPGRSLRGLHIVSAAFTSFARGLNDTPKVVALGYFLAGGHGNLAPLFLVTGVAMALGGILQGMPVARVLAEKVADLDECRALCANLTAAVLVAAASPLGLPVSTTHVSTAAIAGMGLRRGVGGVRLRVLRDIALSWVATLPLAGAMADVFYIFLNHWQWL